MLLLLLVALYDIATLLKCLLHHLHSITPPTYAIYKLRYFIVIMIMCITGSDEVTVIAVHGVTVTD